MPRKIGQQFTTKARERRYDFEKMGVTLDGEVFLLEKGSDYQCSEPALRTHLRQYAKDRGLVFASQVRSNGKKIEGVEVAIASSVEELPELAGSGAKVGGNSESADMATEPTAMTSDSGLRVAS